MIVELTFFCRVQFFSCNLLGRRTGFTHGSCEMSRCLVFHPGSPRSQGFARMCAKATNGNQFCAKSDFTPYGQDDSRIFKVILVASPKWSKNCSTSFSTRKKSSALRVLFERWDGHTAHGSSDCGLHGSDGRLAGRPP